MNTTFTKLGITLFTATALAAPVFGYTTTNAPANPNQVQNPPAEVPPADDGSHHQTAKGAAVGAVVGHFAGHHAVLGAMAGGAAGAIKKHHDKKMARRAAKQAQQAQPASE